MLDKENRELIRNHNELKIYSDLTSVDTETDLQRPNLQQGQVHITEIMESLYHD